MGVTSVSRRREGARAGDKGARVVEAPWIRRTRRCGVGGGRPVDAADVRSDRAGAALRRRALPLAQMTAPEPLALSGEILQSADESAA